MSSFSARIIAGNDDGYLQDFAGGTWRPTFNFVESGANQFVALRWQSVTIPQGATINSASITLRTPNSGSINDQSLKIRGIAEDNTSDFPTNPNARTRTTAAVNWSITGAAINTDYTSPDIKTIIQEIVDRAGWSSGNALGIFIDDNGSSFFLDYIAFEASSTTCALLSVDYTEATTTSTTTTSTSTSTSTSTTTTSTSTSTSTSTTTTLTSTSTSTTTTSTSTTSTSTTTTSTSTTTTSTSTTTTSTSTTTLSTSTTTTSTSTTTTSTSTTSTSTTTLPEKDFWGIKVIKPSPLDPPLSPRNFFLNSHYKELNIHRRGAFKGTYVRFNGMQVTVDFPPLNYRPLVLVYMQRANHDGTIDTNFHLLEWSYFGATKEGFVTVKIYNNKFVIDYSDDLVDDFGGNYSIEGYFYVFREEVRE